MTAVRSHRDLVVWQRAMELAEQCYRLTAAFPREEVYGMTSQLRRACVSIPSNLAEGHNHGSTAVFMRHVAIALGSQAEAETQLELAVRLGFASEATAAPVFENVAEVGRMLHGLVRSLEARLSEVS